MLFISVVREHLFNEITFPINKHFKPYFDSILREDFLPKAARKKTKSRVSFKNSTPPRNGGHAVFVQRLLLGNTKDLQRHVFKLTRQFCLRVLELVMIEN